MRSFAAIFPTALALLFVLLPVAEAQAPTPAMTVAISGLPAEFTGLASNATVPVTFKVDVNVRNVVCPQPSAVPITITVNAASPPAFFTVAADPAGPSVNIPAGAHAQAGTTQSAEVTLTATLKEILQNASVPVEVLASAAAPSGCQGAGAISPAEAAATIYANMTAPPPPPAPTPEPAESPGPGALMGILAAVAAAAVYRRRSA